MPTFPLEFIYIGYKGYNRVTSIAHNVNRRDSETTARYGTLRIAGCWQQYNIVNKQSAKYCFRELNIAF